MSEKNLWAVAVPFAGMLIAAAGLVGVFLVLTTFSAVPKDAQSSLGTGHAVPVQNRCSVAVQLGWVALDPRVPFDKEAVEHFFVDALYVEDSEWPVVDEYSRYPNQTGIINPGKESSLVLDETKSPRQRALIMKSFAPKDGRSSGSTAQATLDVFDMGNRLPEEVVTEDRDGACWPRPPLDRRYRY